MNDQDLNPMEGEILTSEEIQTKTQSQPASQEPKAKRNFRIPKLNLTEKIKKLVIFFRKPRFIITIALLLIIPIVYFGFTSLRTGMQTEIFIPINDLDTSSPSPTITEQRKLIGDKMSIFRTQINTAETEFNSLILPILDLNVDF